MRGFLFTILLSVGLVAATVWYLDLLPSSAHPGEPGPTSSTEDGRRPLGPFLYTPVPLLPAVRADRDPGRLKDPLVIDGHLVVTEKQDVPSKRAGQILFIGEEIPDGAPLPPGPIYTARVFQGGKESLKRYRRLEEGARIQEDQMVALLDYSLALNDWMSKKAKIDAAQADLQASIKTRQEAQGRLERLDSIRIQGRNFVTAEDYSAAVLTRDRYKYEEEAKRVAVIQAAIDAEQAHIILKEHDIRNKIPGTSILKTIYKHRGEAVKEQDPVVQLYNLDRLRAEGLVEVQYLSQLREGMPVTLEPLEEEAPLRVLSEHRGEITGVAVSGHDQNPLIVSGSLDGTVRVWTRTQAQALRVLFHPAPVRAVACSPRGAARPWLLTGCARTAARARTTWTARPINRPGIRPGASGPTRTMTPSPPWRSVPMAAGLPRAATITSSLCGRPTAASCCTRWTPSTAWIARTRGASPPCTSRRSAS